MAHGGPCSAWTGVLSLSGRGEYGGRSSVAERLTVAQEVAGSIPVAHPIYRLAMSRENVVHENRSDLYRCSAFTVPPVARGSMSAKAGSDVSAIGYRDHPGTTPEDPSGHQRVDDAMTCVDVQATEALRLRHRQPQTGHFEKLRTDTEREMFKAAPPLNRLDAIDDRAAVPGRRPCRSVSKDVQHAAPICRVIDTSMRRLPRGGTGASGKLKLLCTVDRAMSR
jgi:hypothetical protein